MDDTDRKILDLLRADARTAHAEIGRQVGLAASSVTERIKKLVALNLIRRWTIDVDHEACGLPVLAFVNVFVQREGRHSAFAEAVGEMEEVLECHHVTGEWSFLLKVRAGSIRELETFMLARLQSIPSVEKTDTVIALSSSKGA